MEIKFNIGDKVMHRGDRVVDSETQEVSYSGDESEQVREVLSIQVKEDGVYYTVTSRDVDVKARDVVNGVMTLAEADLIGVEEYEEIKAEAEKSKEK